MGSHFVLTERLQRYNCPFLAVAMQPVPLDAIMNHAPREHVPEWGPRDRAYDLGRIRFFVDEFRAARAIDPVTIKSGGRLDPDPVMGHRVLNVGGSFYSPPEVYDGNHRMAAAVLLELPVIEATYEGELAVLQWLKGEV